MLGTSSRRLAQVLLLRFLQGQRRRALPVSLSPRANLENVMQRKEPAQKPEKKLPGDEERPKEKRVKERASEPERVNQDPQFDPSHIQKD
jgi:hypothetical protein